MPQDDQLQSIEQTVSELAKKPAISRSDFLDLAKQAVVAYKENPANREQIARIMTGVWMGFEEVKDDEVMHEIGGEFADLEMPDVHVALGDYNSVKEKWQGLEQKINDATRT